MRRRLKALAWTAAALAGLCVVLAIAGILVFQSAWFQDRVRERMISEVERATGGRTEIGAFRFDWHTLTAEVAPFVLHGTEPAGARPFFRADSIRVGLKIVSMLDRDVNIRSLAIAKPELTIFVRPDGTTNLPHPRVARRSRPFVEQILRLAIRHVELHDGYFEYNSQRIPLDLQGERLNTVLLYDSYGPRYRGDVSFSTMRLNAKAAKGLAFDLAASVAVENDRLRVPSAVIRMPRSTISVSGEVLDWVAPVGDFSVRARVAVADVNRPLDLRVSDRGDVDFNGRVRFDRTGLRLAGRAAGRGVNFRTPVFQFDNASFHTNAEITLSRVSLTDLTVAALGGSYQGRVTIDDWKRFRAEGEARGLSIQQLARAQRQVITSWEGSLTGPVRASGVFTAQGVRDVLAEGTLAATPVQGGPGISGSLQLSYDQRAAVLQVGQSRLITGQSAVVFSGTLGQSLDLDAQSRNIQDLLPLFSIAGVTPPQNIPVTLVRGGAGRLTATVTGPLSNPVIAGHVELGTFEYAKQIFDRLAADFSLTRTGLDARNLTVLHDDMRLTGAGRLGLAEWRTTSASPVSGAFELRNGSVARLLAEAGQNYPLTGAVSGRVALGGTVGAPAMNATVNATGVTAWDEAISRLQVNLRYAGQSLEIADGTADADGGRLQFSGAWKHAAGSFRDGSLSFHASAEGVSLERLAHIRDLQRGVGGALELNASGTVRVAGQQLDLESLTGSAAVTNVTLGGKPAGNARVTVNSNGLALNVSAEASLREARIRGRGEWRLEGNYPGRGQITFAPVAFAAVNDVVAELRGETPVELAFQGTITGSADVSGPLRDLNALHAEVRLDQVRLTPNPASVQVTAIPRELALQNAEPVVFDVSRTGAEIRSARFTATDTVLEASGKVGFGEQNPWNAAINGSVDLQILRIFHADLLASGHSTVSATIRGPLAQPQVRGRLELKNASLYLENLPNGIDKANGVILFDRTRATIQSLTGESGGGRVSVTGFVGFGVPILTYRLAARADGVRYRSPQGASVTMDALLDLTGTSRTSILAGNVTVAKASFTPNTDIGSILAEAAKPVATPSEPNAYFRGLQFDVHVESSQTLELQTSLARGLQADVDLRVRGTPERPVVLGNVSVNQGQIEFFGNRYTINRGEVNFFNPLRIEPVLDLDLETRVRGVTVDIILSGSPNRLNLSYRSDPPLRSEQIVALLAVGRAPNAPGTLASEQATSQAGSYAGGSNDLLGQALTAPLTGRLERFFGVSHIKIDPQITDITTVPQARLTLEQQISNNVTLTYITNLTRTQEQLVQVEWDLNRKWSVVAIRDENGLFGVDFQYRKRF